MVNKIQKLGLKFGVALLAAVLLIGAVVAVSNHYEKNKPKSQVEILNEEKSRLQSALGQSESEVSALETRNDQLRVECEKGHAYYARLTPAQRATVTAPNCGPSRQ